MGRKNVKSLGRSEYDRLLTLLKEARLRCGMTQTDLAEKLQERQAFVSKYENGDRRLDVIEFLDVTKALGIDPHNIISELS